jgi:DNA-directed RNA polymerase subunit M/transcription elongation factor TFIIS
MDRLDTVAYLTPVLKSEKNARIFYANIKHQARLKNIPYPDLLYEISTRLASRPPAEVLALLRRGEVGLDAAEYTVYRRLEEEENAFITTPLEIEEGVLECGKCKSRRVFSYSYQGRSGDESMIVKATCANCGHKWKE